MNYSVSEKFWELIVIDRLNPETFEINKILHTPEVFINPEPNWRRDANSLPHSYYFSFSFLRCCGYFFSENAYVVEPM